MVGVMTLGVIVTILIFAVASFFLFSTMSGATTLTRALGIGAVGGVVGSIVTIFSNAYQFLIACIYGHLGLYGYLFVGGLLFCLIVWFVNGLKDVKQNRPISFVD